MVKQYRNSFSLILMIVITGITQVFTLLKTSMVAGQFGTSMQMDAYNFANSIVSFLFGFIASAASTVVIPSYIKDDDRKGADTFITLMYAFISFVMVVMIVFRFQFIGLFSNKGELYLNIACNVMWILLLANFLFSLTNITTAYFQCIGKYNIPKLLNLMTQVFTVIALCVFHDLTIIQYTIILAASLLLNFTVDILLAVKYGWRYKPRFTFRDPQANRMFRMFFPIVLSTGIYKLSLLIDSTIAARLDTGQLSVLGYATQIVNMVNTILLGNLTIYCYPKIVKRIKENKPQSLFWEQTAFFHLVVCLMFSGFVTVGHEGVAILFERGNFNSAATDLVFVCAMIYIAGQPINMVRDLLYRYFYAVGDTATPASNSVMVSVVNITVSLILVQFIGLYGIILGTVTASFASMMRIVWKFHKKIGFDVSKKKLLLSFVTNLLIALATVGVVYLTKWLLPVSSVIVSLLVFGVETLAVFILLTFCVKRNIISVIKNI